DPHGEPVAEHRVDLADIVGIQVIEPLFQEVFGHRHECVAVHVVDEEIDIFRTPGPSEKDCNVPADDHVAGIPLDDVRHRGHKMVQCGYNLSIDVDGAVGSTRNPHSLSSGRVLPGTILIASSAPASLPITGCV